MDDWSIEATLPKRREIETLARLVPAGKEVYLSTLPHVSLDRQIETAGIVRAAGLEPVPHVAVRYFADRAQLSGYLARIARDARVTRCLVIGGDLQRPRGAFDSAVRMLDCGVLADHGIARAGVAAYPEGHPRIADAVLERALSEKLEVAGRAGVEAHVVTQFCFAARPVNAWLARFRDRWPEIPVRIGLAGPTSVKALMRYAVRCGVKAPRGGLADKLSMAARLVRTVAPDGLIAEIDESVAASGGDSNLSAHFFSFGGLERTARWAIEAQGTRGRAPASEDERAGPGIVDR